MVFSSILFLFKFLPFALLLFFVTPKKHKNLTLLLLSLVFYSWGEPKYILIMVSSIFVDYFISLGIEKYRKSTSLCRFLLGLSVLYNIGILVFFKYFDFIIGNVNSIAGTTINSLNLLLPLGISFYTFQTLSYTIDVYRGKVSAERNIIDFGAYVCLFPQLIAGPIVKYTQIKEELKNRFFNPDQIEEGIRTFIIGLGSKVLIANNIGSLWDEVISMDIGMISTPLAWLGIIAFSLQIYFDFSGYSLMAIGLGKILGFNFPQNFNFPYISKSASEFWRRWHMTLGSWFKEYLYIPLGGNKKRMYLNFLIVWLVTGLWHGAEWNFVLWGLYFFVVLAIERLFLLKILDGKKILSRLYFILMILFGWVIFAIPDLSKMVLYIQRMLSFEGGSDWLYHIRNYGVILVLGILLSTPLIDSLYDKIKSYKLVLMPAYAVILFVSTAYLVDSSYNPFLYFRF